MGSEFELIRQSQTLMLSEESRRFVGRTHNNDLEDEEESKNGDH